MADNISGGTVANDNIGGIQYPRVKFVWGVDGVAADVSASAPLPVEIASDQSAIPTMDAGPNWDTVCGVSGAAVVSSDMTTAAAVTDAPTTGQKLVIVDIVVSTDTAMFILFAEETTGTIRFKVFLPANGTVQITPRGKVKLATANKKLTADASVAGNVAITTTYYSEA